MKSEYIQQVKNILREDLYYNGDVSPNGIYAVVLLSEKYKGKISQDILDMTIEESKWIQLYLARCRHMNRPIDTALITGVIDTLNYY